MNHFLKSVQKNKNIRMGVLFCSFMFVQFIILRMSNQAGRGYLEEQRQELVYLFIQLVVIGGFFSHALIKSKVQSEKACKGATLVSLALCMAGTAVMLFSPAASLFYLMVTGLSVFFLGFTGGAVYCQLASLNADKARTGLCVGAGYAAAVALQFCLQLQWTVIPALSVMLVVAFGALGFLLLKSTEPLALPEQKESQTDIAPPSLLFYTSVITLALLLFTSYYNSYIHHLQIASGYTDYNVYTWPRLLMIPAILLFGFLGDLRGGKYLPLGTLCVVVVALLNTVLLGRETYILNMCLYYVAITAVIAYYNLTFTRLAARTRHPAIWVVMGRVIDSATVVLGMTLKFSTFSQAAILMTDIAALVVAIIMMTLTGAFDLSEHARHEAQFVSETAPVHEPQTETETDPFSAIQESYRITPSEMKVLRELVGTDDKQDAIALRLNISVSTLRHHITSIYKKTGTQTRSALCKLVMNQ